MTGALQVVYQNLRAGSPYWVVYQDINVNIWPSTGIKMHVDATQGVYFGHARTEETATLGLISLTGTLRRQFNFYWRRPICCAVIYGDVFSVVGDASGNSYSTCENNTGYTGGGLGENFIFYQLSSSNAVTYYKRSSNITNGIGTAGIALTSDGSTVQTRNGGADLGWVVFKVTAGAYVFQKNIYNVDMKNVGRDVSIEDFKTDASDFMYFAGSGSRPLNLETRGYLVKSSADGATVLWAQTYSGDYIPSYNTIHDSVAIDASSNVYVCGWVNTSPKKNYIVKYNSSGVLQWHVTLDLNITSVGGQSSRLTTDSSGNVYAAMGSTATDTATTIFKYNSSGVLQWQRQFTLVNPIPTRPGNFAVKGLQVVGEFMYVSGSGNAGRPIIWKLPIDGSLTGTYYFTGYLAGWNISYNAAAYTSSSGSGTSDASTSWATANLSYTLSNATVITTNTNETALVKKDL